MNTDRILDRLREESIDIEVIKYIEESIEELIPTLVHYKFRTQDDRLTWLIEDVIWDIKKLPDSTDRTKAIQIVSEYLRYDESMNEYLKLFNGERGETSESYQIRAD